MVDPVKDAALRTDAANCIGGYLGHQRTGHVVWSKDYTILKHLLGYGPDHLFTYNNFTDEDRYKCELLVSPHGRTCFRAMCLKQGLKDLLIT